MLNRKITPSDWGNSYGHKAGGNASVQRNYRLLKVKLEAKPLRRRGIQFCLESGKALDPLRSWLLSDLCCLRKGVFLLDNVIRIIQRSPRHGEAASASFQNTIAPDDRQVTRLTCRQTNAIHSEVLFLRCVCKSVVICWHRLGHWCGRSQSRRYA